MHEEENSKATIKENEGNVDDNLPVEERRKLNIKRNAEFLRSLGLSGESTHHTKASNNNNDKKSAKKRTPKKQKINEDGNDDNDDNDDSEELTRPVRRSSRLQGIPIEENEIITVDDGTVAIKAPKVKNESLFEYDFEYSDGEDGEKRNRISAAALRDLITTTNLEHLEMISDEQIGHCVMRIQSMSNKRLATRIKMIARSAGKHSYEKLLVFYYGLKLSGLNVLAEVCKDALQRIGIKF